MTLLEAIEKLSSFNQSYTIYAAQPWTAESQTIVAPEPEAGGFPVEAGTENLEYFLEIFIANEILESSQTAPPTEKCARLIQYAKTDA
jgi:hypothetical protein